MAQWEKVKSLPTQMLGELYPSQFPMEVRYYLATWIEEQHWEDFDIDDLTQEHQALQLLEQIVSFLQEMSQQNSNVVEGLRLQHIAVNMGSVFRSQPLLLVKTVQEILRQERALLMQGTSATSFAGSSTPQPPCPPAHSPLPAAGTVRDEGLHSMDQLVFKALELQSCRQQIHKIQKELQSERQGFESMLATVQRRQSNTVDPELPEQVQKLQTNVQQMEFNVQALSLKRVSLLEETALFLEQCLSHLILKIQTWRREQHLATIGAPFKEDLSPLQTWCEQLLGVIVKLREEFILAVQEYGGAEPIQKLQDQLEKLLQTLIQSSLIVDKQPPQVIKTQSKFSTSVRFLLGEKMTPGRPALLKAQIVTEAQAKNLVQLTALPMDSVGELVSHAALLDYNSSNKTTCATFKNMCIKKIKRADRRGSESVTEEKFAIHFSGEISIVGFDSSYRVQVLSLPIVVIVHGSQDISAMATIIWDCAFSDLNRLPFVVPDRVPWKEMCKTLESKFMFEVQTQRGLDCFNQHFLAEKIFRNLEEKDYSNMKVSWLQFNKEVLPGRQFTFWQWFEGVLELTKKHLRNYWSDGLIFGFIGKQHLHLILENCPSGTFLLRFSDSEIGGITIAYNVPSENGGTKIQNLQPFTKKDLEIRCLGDRVRDIEGITHIYPNFHKNNVFKKYYTDEPRAGSSGYIGVSIHTKVADEGCTAGTSASAASPSEAAQDASLSSSLPSYPSDSFYSTPTMYQNEPSIADMSFPGTTAEEHSISLFSLANMEQSPESPLPDIMDLGLSLLETDIYGVPH